jgi:hypothetical protein
MASKKIKADVKPQAELSTRPDTGGLQDAQESVALKTTESETDPIATAQANKAQSVPVSKKKAKQPASEKKALVSAEQVAPASKKKAKQPASEEKALVNEEQSALAPKEIAKANTLDKGVKMKRLTLDISKRNCSTGG